LSRKAGLGAETLGGIIQNPQADFVQRKFGFRPKFLPKSKK
jgi:hypothetical protein